jgi:single-stranded-DNA-specific exonuclease
MDTSPRWLIDPCPPQAAADLASELGVHRTTAEVLVRRGHATAQAARSFLELDGPIHDPMLLGDMPAACARIGRAIASGERVCVHGDYDADGICATALAVLALRELGADVDWHVPSRFDEGYGVASETVERLAGDGVKLLLTVDCGITAADQVKRAATLGMDVIVTDHHRPADVLPACPLVCTRPSQYPFPELAGTGVVFKLAQALYAQAGRDPAALDLHLDLVALATIADVVPLVDENRGLVRAGLRRLARTTRPGLRALMASARVDRARIGASDVGFRLAPRINAAGRLCHPGEALELLLTDDEPRARALAARLESLNRERQSVEDAMLRDALEQLESRGAEWRRRRAYVLSSPEWHEGVVGIVASRLVERCGRAVVLIAERGEEAKGSGRSIPAYDLHSGLSACREHLQRYGGHRVAAGLTMATGDVEAFADALATHAGEALAGCDLQARQRIDAVLAPAEASLELADELARLEPCGLGNPGVTLLAPAAAVHGVERMGDGRHLRMAVELGGFRCRAVWFGHGASADDLRAGGRHDVAYRLSRNEWNGAASVQMLVRAVGEVPAGVPAQALDLAAVEADRPPGAAHVDDMRGRGVQVATIARLIAAGERVIVLVADARRRRGMLGGPLEPSRLGTGAVVLAEYDQAAQIADPERRFGAAVALDPPSDRAGGELLAELGSRMPVHLVWGEPEIQFARQVLEAREPLRPALVVVWQALRAGENRIPLAPDTVARCRTVLAEVGLDPAGQSGAERIDLNASPTYRAAVERVEDSLRFLQSQAG